MWSLNRTPHLELLRPIFVSLIMQSIEPMPRLFGVDWVIIVFNIFIINILGIWLGRGQRNARDYFLGGRDLPWWGVALSILATETSALTFIGVPAMAYADNLGFIQIVLGYALGRVLLAFFMVQYYFKTEIYSPYALIGKAFGQSAQKIGALFFLVAGTLGAGVRVYVTCIPLQIFLGWSVSTSILFFVVLSLVYTWFGGIRSVVWTDSIQFVLLFAGGLFVFFYIPTLIEGGWSSAFDQANDEGKLSWLNFDLSLSKPYNFWMGIIGAVVFVFFTHGIDQLVALRVLACRSVKDGRKALIFCGICILPVMLLFLAVGVMLWVYYQNVAVPIEIPQNSMGKNQNDYIFPIFIIAETPIGIKGLLFVGIFAAAMSSVSSALSALASVSTMDLGFFKNLKDESLKLKWSRHSTLFWGIVLIFVAYLSREVESVMNAAFSLVGLTSGALLGGVVLSFFIKRGPAWPVVFGMIFSLFGMIWINWLKSVHWPWYTLIGFCLMVLVSLPLFRFAKRL